MHMRGLPFRATEMDIADVSFFFGSLQGDLDLL